MPAYDHGGDVYGNPGVALDFSVNTNPLGMPEEVREALVSRVDEFTRYPDPECRELRAVIARYENVPEDWVLCGNGAADLIYRLCCAEKPRTACVYPPCFSEYEKALSQVGCVVSRRKLGDRDCSHADMHFLCHPNNPTGRLIPMDILDGIMNGARQSGTTIVVDECFLDFTGGESAKRYLPDMPRLVILKAFTKIYAMAGLRLGYLLTADRSLIEKMTAAAQCWSVSVPAQIAGVAALGCAGWIQKTRRLVAEEREYLAGSLRGLGITVFPSDANFMLLRCGKSLYEPLLRRGIMIRPCANFGGLDESYYRICVKTRPENTRLIGALKEVLHG